MSFVETFVFVFVELAVEFVVFEFTLVFELLVPPEETLLFVFTLVETFVFWFVLTFVFWFTFEFVFVLVAVLVDVLVVVVVKEFASQNSVPAVQVPLGWAEALWN